jgi:hypothetical protein
MDSPTQPTFIPHEAVSATQGRSRGGGGLSELFLLVSIILFIISAALGGGVFLYSQYLQTSNQNKLSELNSAQNAFDPTLIQQLTRLDTRMNTAQTLLNAHLAPSQLFTILDQSTVQDISFNSLTYDASNPQQIMLTMTGTAGSVNSIALQAQIFSQSNVITDPIFSNINAQQGGVNFDFTGSVDASALSYESYVAGMNGQASSSVQTQTEAPAAAATPPSPFESSSTPATTQQ